MANDALQMLGKPNCPKIMRLFTPQEIYYMYEEKLVELHAKLNEPFAEHFNMNMTFWQNFPSDRPSYNNSNI